MPSLFTHLINGDIPSTKVYEDDICFAFLDIHPVTKGHTLLVPREEYIRMTDLPDTILQHLFLTAKKLMQHMKTNLGADYVHMSVEGIEVPHFHIHLIPNMLGTNIVDRHRTQYDNENEAKEIAATIAKKL